MFSFYSALSDTLFLFDIFFVLIFRAMREGISSSESDDRYSALSHNMLFLDIFFVSDDKVRDARYSALSDTMLVLDIFFVFIF